MPWKNGDTEWPTLGEAFLNRELKKQKREGVEHYVLGQHLAQWEASEPDEEMLIARLSYIGPLGAVSLPVVKMKGGEWEVAMRKCRVVGLSMDYGIRPLPDDFELTDEMKAALAKLEDEVR